MGMNVTHQKYSGYVVYPAPNYDAEVLMTNFLDSVALLFSFSALKPKFAASEKIKELSTELVMVNVEASEKLITTFTMFTMFT